MCMVLWRVVYVLKHAHIHTYSLEEEVATNPSILAWKILWTEEPGRLPSIGLHRFRHDWSDLGHIHTHKGVRVQKGSWLGCHLCNINISLHWRQVSRELQSRNAFPAEPRLNGTPTMLPKAQHPHSLWTSISLPLLPSFSFFTSIFCKMCSYSDLYNREILCHMPCLSELRNTPFWWCSRHCIGANN